MSILVIHPKDSTTSFLDIVYNALDNPTIISMDADKDKIRDMIEEHDQVMMMGHGTSYGLLAVGMFPSSDGYVVDESMVKALSKKNNSIFIWCNADQFVQRYKLKGFYSGMFISEVGEANYCGLVGTTQELVDESNMKFVNLLGSVITQPVNEIYKYVRDQYGLLAEINNVALYNNDRLYLN